MNEKKGYGLIIPSDFEVGKWEKETAQNILDQLKKLTRDVFYRMAKEADIDLELLESAGYEFDGISEIAIIELEAYLSENKHQEVKDAITPEDYRMSDDFQYIFHLYNDRHNALTEYYSVETVDVILESREIALRDERENVRKLMGLFINEFDEDKTVARKQVLKEYGGHFISMPELDSFLSYRDIVEWYCGDTFDPDFKNDVEKMKAIRDLIPLYKLISEGGEFQIQSTRYRHQKTIINDKSSDILANAIALALKMLRDRDPYLSAGTNFDKTYSWVDLTCAHADNGVEEILETINLGIERYEDELDLNLFYYLADNAIRWPKDITLTKRYLFLYRLAKFFQYISESEFEDTELGVTRKEIVDGIKFRIKQMRKKDMDNETLNFYLHRDTL